MRLALLSSLERTSDGEIRALMPLGGRAVLAWQIDLAVALGCEKIVCLCEEASPELMALRRQAGQAGATFNLIQGPRHLVGMVAADHEIIVIADGLVIDPKLGLEMFSDQRGIAALPAEAGIAAGFERIDAEQAWAGILVARGNIVERLAEMPSDSDTVALLLRLALQSGARRLRVSEQVLANGDVILADNSEKLDHRENALLDRHISSSRWTGPGNALAHILARRLAPAALQNGPKLAMAGAAALATGAIALSWFDQSVWAVPLLVIAAFLLSTMLALQGLNTSLLGRERKERIPFITSIILDIVIIVSLTLPAALFALPRRIFLPLVLIGSLRLAAKGASERWRALWSDRSLLLLLLVPAAWLGVLSQSIASIILLVLACGIVFNPGNRA